MSPDEIRDVARAAFAGQPAKADGTLALSVGRNPWHALDDALEAVQPHIEARTLRTATKQQWEQMIAQLADEMMRTRGQAVIEEAVRRGVDEKLPALAEKIAAAARVQALRGFADWLDKQPDHSACADLAREQADLIAGRGQ